ncbi:MAG TPA: hypothetical protein PLZ57_04930 [Pseudobdellovibrionaceae bacterium]|nr:hypothetical protein [Pseudobdellovibrionaceae bacterium]
MLRISLALMILLLTEGWAFASTDTLSSAKAPSKSTQTQGGGKSNGATTTKPNVVAKQARELVEKYLESLQTTKSGTELWRTLDRMETELRQQFEREPEEQTIGTDQEPSAAQIYFTFEEVFAASREVDFRDKADRRREICAGLSARIAFPLRSSQREAREVTWHEARAQRAARLICGDFPTSD